MKMKFANTKSNQNYISILWRVLLWRVFFGCIIFSFSQGQEVAFEEPTHPKTLSSIDTSSYTSLMDHGVANLRYGR
jgi:nucleoside recognition membrane protein YjiH